MISERELRDAAKELLGNYMPHDFPYAGVCETLQEYEKDKDIKLSGYGYIAWAIDKYGFKCTYKNMLASGACTGGYLADAVKFRDDMPVMLVNANTYAMKLLSNIADMETCFKQLEGMTFPYVLYILFAGSDQKDIVERYKPHAREQLRRYPSTCDLLPESYKKVAEEVLNENAE